ncbi:MAG TPA: transporter substrate-binding domain-containing protein, partial [Reyranella sp.]|nr:transporter substrate-binding domain-containing protein [Reyranella sp.]
CLALATWATAGAQDVRSPDAALAQVLEEARASCGQPNPDRLVKVLCGGTLRIGVRDYYPLFSTRDGEKRDGYELDIADAIADRLGVKLEFVRVNAASRIPLLAEDRIDLVIATMGHNTQRDSQVRFVRPHYYQSETTVVGPRAAIVASWLDMPGRTVCATVGNGSNAELVSHDVRLMLFDEAGVLPGKLRDGTCQLAAQDDSFFAYYFTEPDFAAAFSQKFGFAQVPWGMAVARTGSDRLARALDLMSQIFHRDGVFLDIARKHHISTNFLREQQAVWKRIDCDTATGSTNQACILPALDADLEPTSFAARVSTFESWINAKTGTSILLPMLKTVPAWSLFLGGVANSLILIAGALLSTLVFALLLGGAQAAPWRLLHWPAHALTVVLQSSPIVLTLVIAAALAREFFDFSDVVALGAAIMALGLVNGSNAGQAISEAVATVRAEDARDGVRRGHRFRRAVGRSSSQLVSFLVNAAKGTPIASFIGAPELLSALTDITSFSTGRVTTYWLLLIFYIVVVMAVVWLCGRLQHWLARSYAT